MGFVQGKQYSLCLSEVDTMFLSVLFRNQVLPEIIVKILVQKRSIHIQQDTINMFQQLLRSHNLKYSRRLRQSFFGAVPGVVDIIPRPRVNEFKDTLEFLKKLIKQFIIAKVIGLNIIDV